MKECRTCKQTLPSTSFRPQSRVCIKCRNADTRHWKHTHRERVREHARNWRRLNPERTKEHARKTMYGISPDEYRALRELHSNKCAVCKRDKPLHIDHCHITGKIRGLLCHNCNTALGLLHESTDSIKALLEYIIK